MARPHTHSLVEAVATCQRCTWTTSGKNAQALAAQHFDKKGHQVRVRVTNQIIYGQHTGARRGDGQGRLAV